MLLVAGKLIVAWLVKLWPVPVAAKQNVGWPSVGCTARLLPCRACPRCQPFRDHDPPRQVYFRSAVDLISDQHRVYFRSILRFRGALTSLGNCGSLPEPPENQSPVSERPSSTYLSASNFSIGKWRRFSPLVIIPADFLWCRLKCGSFPEQATSEQDASV